MKAETLDRYAQRINRAIELLTERLNHGSVPALEDLADAAALSSFHIHRVFRLMTGETVNEAVRRIRLAKGSATIEQIDYYQRICRSCLCDEPRICASDARLHWHVG